MSSQIDDCRLYIVVREDLQMPIGKAMGQAAHAAEGTLLYVRDLDPHTYHQYLHTGNRKKIVLRVKSLDKLLKVQAKCQELGLTCHLVTDAAHTVFAEPTITCLGIGPVAPVQQEELKQAIKGLQLYS